MTEWTLVPGYYYKSWVWRALFFLENPLTYTYPRILNTHGVDLGYHIYHGTIPGILKYSHAERPSQFLLQAPLREYSLDSEVTFPVPSLLYLDGVPKIQSVARIAHTE